MAQTCYHLSFPRGRESRKHCIWMHWQLHSQQTGSPPTRERRVKPNDGGTPSKIAPGRTLLHLEHNPVTLVPAIPARQALSRARPMNTFPGVGFKQRKMRTALQELPADVEKAIRVQQRDTEAYRVPTTPNGRQVFHSLRRTRLATRGAFGRLAVGGVLQAFHHRRGLA